MRYFTTSPDDFLTAVRRHVTQLDGHAEREYDGSELMHHLEWDEENEGYFFDLDAVATDIDRVTFTPLKDDIQ